jgi:hypothetical protein
MRTKGRTRTPAKAGAQIPLQILCFAFLLKFYYYFLLLFLLKFANIAHFSKTKEQFLNFYYQEVVFLENSNYRERLT